jgi:hypothetical protein
MQPSVIRIAIDGPIRLAYVPSTKCHLARPVSVRMALSPAGLSADTVQQAHLVSAGTS